MLISGVLSVLATGPCAALKVQAAAVAPGRKRCREAEDLLDLHNSSRTRQRRQQQQQQQHSPDIPRNADLDEASAKLAQFGALLGASNGCITLINHRSATVPDCFRVNFCMRWRNTCSRLRLHNAPPELVFICHAPHATHQPDTCQRQ